MKLFFTTTLLLFGINLSAQYNYGLEVEQQDAKIDGKLDIVDNINNVIIGQDSGLNNVGMNNVFVGFETGIFNNQGNFNVFVGNRSGQRNFNGYSNTMMGFSSGFNNGSYQNSFFGAFSGFVNLNGKRNTYLGYEAGFFSQGSDNVFLGAFAGKDETESNILYIENSASKTPLIFGEFNNDKAGINWDSTIPLPATLSVNGTLSVADTTTLATLHISETAKLEPQMIEPSTCATAAEYGLIYYDSSVTPNKLKLCSDAGWVDLN